MGKKSPPKTGPLYPLDEEESYGAPPPALPPPLPGYQKRERKTKVYGSYAVSRYTITQFSILVVSFRVSHDLNEILKCCQL